MAPLKHRKKVLKRRTGARGYAAPKATIDDILAARARLNQASVDFLKVDVETALTFAKIALQTDNSEKRQRNCENARKGYDTIQRLVEKVSLTNGDALLLSERMEQLRSNLIQLGEVF